MLALQDSVHVAGFPWVAYVLPVGAAQIGASPVGV